MLAAAAIAAECTIGCVDSSTNVVASGCILDALCSVKLDTTSLGWKEPLDARRSQRCTLTRGRAGCAVLGLPDPSENDDGEPMSRVPVGGHRGNGCAALRVRDSDMGVSRVHAHLSADLSSGPSCLSLDGGGIGGRATRRPILKIEIGLA